MEMCYSLEKTKFSVDWLNVRLDVSDLEHFILRFLKKFNLSASDLEVRSSGGVCFFENAYYLPAAGYSSVLFCYNEDENGRYLSESVFGRPGGLMISLSGDGCRYINSLIPDGMNEFVKLCSLFNYNCTRIDLACDFLDPNNKVVPLIQAFALNYYNDDYDIGLACNLKRENLVRINLEHDTFDGGYCPNVTIGSRASRKGTMQLYNKRLEVSRGRLSSIAEQTFKEYGVTDFWWRLEYRCKSFAQEVFSNLLEYGVFSAFACAMDNFGRFYNNRYDSNHAAETNEDWQLFYDWVMENAIHLVELVAQPYVKTSVSSTFKWCEHNASLLYRIAQIAFFNPVWYDELITKGLVKHHQNPRYRPFDEDFKEAFGCDL